MFQRRFQSHHACFCSSSLFLFVGHVSFFANDLSGDIGFLCLANANDDQNNDSNQDVCEKIAVGFAEEGSVECTKSCCVDPDGFRELVHDCQYWGP